jgi:uncharacterized membrane protein YsdA (DUF1294 family)
VKKPWGRPKAGIVEFVGKKVRAKTSVNRSIIPTLFTACFIGFVAVAALLGLLPKTVLALYLFASITTFFLYGFDKSAAGRNEWRTKESTLHLFALVGGWPGALAAQRLLRHKSAKNSFQVTYWATVLLNSAACIWLMTPAGSKVLKSLIRTV